MPIYLTLAHADAHPSTAREDHSARRTVLGPTHVQAFRDAAALAGSSFLRSKLVVEEDVAPTLRVVRIHADPATELEPDGGLDGVFVEQQAEAGRQPILEWLATLEEGTPGEQAAAARALLEYRAVREMFDEM